jgi:HAD superfamily hydrolase (TIGR01549 family)
VKFPTNTRSRLAALVDVDGTLIDTNYHHALAWSRSFARCGLHPPLWSLHRAIGMGGDHLVTAVTGADVEEEFGDELRAGWAEEYEPFLAEVWPFLGARELLEVIRSAGHVLVLTSSAPRAHLEHYIGLLDAASLIDAVTSADDAGQTKPAPDLVSVAMGKAGTDSAIMIGDSTWDVIAAAKIGVKTIALRTGGFSTEELDEAGALATYQSLTELTEHLTTAGLSRT